MQLLTFWGLTSCHTHIVAVQIQKSYFGEAINKLRDLSDQVPAQIQLIHVMQFLDALWHCADPLEAQIQPAFTIQDEFHAVLSHFQGHSFAFGVFAFPSLGHAAAGRRGGFWG